MSQQDAYGLHVTTDLCTCTLCGWAALTKVPSLGNADTVFSTELGMLLMISQEQCGDN